MYALRWALGRRRLLIDRYQPGWLQSGKIASIGDAAFSLKVTNGQERKTIEFLVDGDTKVEGKLKVGAQATVEYRSAEGRNIAIHIVVRPASGFQAL